MAVHRATRRASGQQGGVRRGLAWILAGSVSALVLLAAVVLPPGAGREAVEADPAGHKAPAGAATRLQGVTPSAARARNASNSPRQLPVPYAYEDYGREMFGLEPRTRNPRQSDLYPAPVRMNRKAAERAASTGSMDVTLPDGSRYPVAFERAEPGVRGNWTWVGRVDSPHGALAAVLTYGRDGVFGVLPTPEGRMLQVQTRNGQAYLQPDPGLVPPGVDPDAPFPDYVVPTPATGRGPGTNGGVPSAAALSARTGGGMGQAPAPHGEAGIPPAATGSTTTGMLAPTDNGISEITVLGVYTTNLVQERGSVAAAETEFLSLLEISNQAHIDSGTRTRFKLVGLLETDYPGGVFNDVVLGDLAANRLKDGLDIHAERDAHGADLVALLRPYAPNDFSCGIAYMNGGGLWGTNTSSDWGYSVTACGAFTMAHELGHNLGSHHDRETATVDGVLDYGAFEFSFGHRQDTPARFATIMAYPNGQPRVGYFSAPDNNLCMGVACGVKDHSDNVRSINLMAETISRFRDPPNTISVMDAKVVEPYEGFASLAFLVRLSSPAPAGGVQFDIGTVEGGTATSGADYRPAMLRARVIPEGEKEKWFLVDVLPDELVEDDETVMVQLSNVRGMEVYDGEAVGLIVDDDPRVTVAGSVVFPEGDVGPSSLYVYAHQSFEGSGESRSYLAVAPDYDFLFEVTNGATVTLEAYVDEETPWLPAVLEAGEISADTRRDILVPRAVYVSGQVKVPRGETPPVAPLHVRAWNVIQDGWGHSQWVYPPDFAYSFKARSGVGVGIDVFEPPAPFVTQRVETFTHGDTVQDVMLSSIPTLSIEHKAVKEGALGTSQTVNLEIKLSVPAPPEGVTFDLVTEDGTASGESDYLQETQSFTIGEGNNMIRASVALFGDDVYEPDEYFKLVAKRIQGAHMPTPGVVWIKNDDPLPVAGDFDRDGKSDLVWHHSGSGRGALWGGAQYGKLRNLVTVRDTEWQIDGIGDFNSDGRADLFWRHGRSGRNTIWLSGDYGSQLGVATVANLDWDVAGVGDFDGDGQSDVLWRNTRTGANTIWRGADSRAQLHVTNVTDRNWTVASVGDFDGDGHADILWRNKRTGANTIWRKGSYASQKRVTGVTDLGWRIVGSGDFDGDGTDDVLWRHDRTGANAIWYAGEYARRKSLTGVNNPDWRVAAVADYDGDGNADIAWRNRRTGGNIVWLGGEYRHQLKVATVPDLKWEVRR